MLLMLLISCRHSWNCENTDYPSNLPLHMLHVDAHNMARSSSTPHRINSSKRGGGPPPPLPRRDPGTRLTTKPPISPMSAPPFKMESPFDIRRPDLNGREDRKSFPLLCGDHISTTCVRESEELPEIPPPLTLYMHHRNFNEVTVDLESSLPPPPAEFLSPDPEYTTPASHQAHLDFPPPPAPQSL